MKNLIAAVDNHLRVRDECSLVQYTQDSHPDVGEKSTSYDKRYMLRRKWGKTPGNWEKCIYNIISFRNDKIIFEAR